MKKERQQELFQEAILLAHKNWWKELDLQGKKKILAVQVEMKDLYWTKWGAVLRIKVNGTTITYNVSFNDILLSPYFAKCLVGVERVAYKLAGSYVYEWQNYLRNMACCVPEKRFEVLEAWLHPSMEVS